MVWSSESSLVETRSSRQRMELDLLLFLVGYYYVNGQWRLPELALSTRCSRHAWVEKRA